jgi:hypothetical protein
MNVPVADELAERELVKPGERDLAGVRVSGEHERDTARPERVGLLGDVREADGGDLGSQSPERHLAVGVPGVRVVQPHDLQPLATHRPLGPLVAQHLDVRAAQGRRDLVGA